MAVKSIRGSALQLNTFYLSVVIQSRAINSSSALLSKYKYKQRKIRRSIQEDDELKAKYERLEEDERPTGCIMCPKRTDVEFDYKNVRLLSQFISPHTGRIYGGNITGLCSRKQNELKDCVKRARHAGFMSSTMKHLEFHDDPKLF